MTEAAAIVLAAGGGAADPDALRTTGGGTALAILLRTLRAAGLTSPVVVLGEGRRAVEDRTDLSGCTIVECRVDGGMIGSLRAGLARLPQTASTALVAPVSHPLVSIATVRALLAAHAEGALVAVPVCDVAGPDAGRRGHPVLFDRSLFGALMGPRADRGAAVIVHEEADRCVSVPVLDRGILADVREPATRGLIQDVMKKTAPESAPPPRSSRRSRPRRGRDR